MQKIYHFLYNVFMKNIIIYKTNTGFTKEYAEMLARRIDGEVIPVNKLKTKTLKEADNIFYGGPLRNNVILGINKFLKKYNVYKDKNIFIFAVGIQPEDSEKRENVIAANGLDLYHVRLYFLLGGVDLNRMSKMKRFFIVQGMKMASKQQGMSEDLIKSRLENPINMVNSSNLDKMVDVYRRVIVRK